MTLFTYRYCIIFRLSNLLKISEVHLKSICLTRGHYPQYRTHAKHSTTRFTSEETLQIDIRNYHRRRNFIRPSESSRNSCFSRSQQVSRLSKQTTSFYCWCWYRIAVADCLIRLLIVIRTLPDRISTHAEIAPSLPTNERLCSRS